MGFRGRQFRQRNRFVDEAKVTVGIDQRLASLPRPDPEDEAPGFAKTKRERRKVRITRDQAVAIDPGCR